jgi:hypothetical protein
MNINYNFKKNKLNGYMDSFSYTKWYEPYTIYPSQMIFALFLLIPYFGGKFLATIIYKDEMLKIYKRNKKSEVSGEK